jgi:hypothetical protein
VSHPQRVAGFRENVAPVEIGGRLGCGRLHADIDQLAKMGEDVAEVLATGFGRL